MPLDRMERVQSKCSPPGNTRRCQRRQIVGLLALDVKFWGCLDIEIWSTYIEPQSEVLYGVPDNEAS
jgi:hypothetical protein